MSKVLLWSDIHIHPHKRKQERLEDCLKALEWVFQTAKSRGITEILFAGDLLHDRIKIESFTYMKVFEILKKYCTGKIKLYLLLGNHDLWYNEDTSVSSTIPFSALPGIHIIGDVCRKTVAGVKWDFIPFTHDPLAALDTLKEFDEQAPYCLGHLSIHGARLNSAGTQSDVVIEHDGEMTPVEPKCFEHYVHVFLGHYHAAQQLGKVEYIGSPLQLSFGEAHQEKHIIVLDCETGEKEYVVNDFSPKHYYLQLHDLDKHDLTNAFVTLLTEDISAVDVADLRKELLHAKGAASFNVRQIEQKLDEETHVIKDAIALLLTEDKMLDRYLDEAGHDGLEKERLLTFGKRIIQHEEVAA